MVIAFSTQEDLFELKQIKEEIINNKYKFDF